MKESCQTPKITQKGERLIELISSFQEKGRMTQMEELQIQMMELRVTEDYS